MKIVVGLGNPGRKYEKTRHNVGFDVLDEIAKQQDASKPKPRFQAETTDVNLGGTKVLLVWPQTYMNKSGSSVQKALDFYKLETNDILVICDDLALPVGKLRFRPKGSAGGQKGLADVMKRVGTDEVARLRIGIGQQPDSWDAADYVLGKFNEDDRIDMDLAISRAANGVTDWVAKGTSFCMNRYNGSN